MRSIRKKAMKKLLSVILAMLTILGVLPMTGIPAYGAASYSLHKVGNLRDYIRNTEGGKMSYITNLRNSEIDVHENDFKAIPMNIAGGRTCICLDDVRVPAKGQTVSWKNVCTITFKDAGYTSDGEFFNLECTLESLKMTGTRAQPLPENTKLTVADVTKEGLISRAYFAHVTETGELYDYTSDKTPGEESVWRLRITDAKGKNMKIPPIAMLYRDVDAFANVDDTVVRESVKAVSGFADDIYISNDSLLLVSENNSLYEGNGLVENEDERNHVLMTMVDPEAVILWRGLTCGTYITPLSLTGYPIPENQKTVDRSYSEAGQTLHYTIDSVFPAVTDENAASSVIVTDELNDILDAENAVTHVYRDGMEVGAEWNTACNGQKIIWSSKNPAAVQGDYSFTIDVRIRDDMALDGRKELYAGDDGRAYYRIPNTDIIEITDRNDEQILITPPEPVYTDVPVGGIALVKDVDRSSFENAHAGDSLHYTFTIENTGEVSLNNIALTDSLDVKDLTINWKDSSDAGSGKGELLPHETVKGTAVYKLTQDDIDLGTVHNTAGVTGTDRLGVSYSAEDDADTVLRQSAEIDLIKTAMPIKGKVAAGDTVVYKFEISNTGNSTITGVSFTDDHELRELTWDRDFSSLLPGEKVSGSASYVLTQADIDEGQVLNTATVTGKGPDGSDVSDTDEARTEIAAEPEILLEKFSNPAVRTGAHAGDVVPFTFAVTNTGNCTLNDIVIEDALPGISDIVIDWDGSGDASTGKGVLSAGESVTAESFYTLTQDDIDRGDLLNQASVTASDSSGNQVTCEDDANVLLPETGEISLDKVSEGEITAEMKPGDILHYNFTVTNTGNVTLSGVSIRDDLKGLGTILFDWNMSSDTSTPAGTLSPGETVTAGADYLIEQSDIDAGNILNNAEAVAKTPSGKDVSGNDDDLREIPMMPELSLVKEVNRKTYENVKAGDTLKYTFTAANTGNCTLAKVSLIDELDGIGDLTYDWSGASSGEGILKPGEILRASAVYTISQKDINAGEVNNTAEVIGYAPDKSSVTAEDTCETALQQNGILSVTKTADVLKVSDARPGDEIVYTMIAENTGNLTVSNVEFSDKKEGLGEMKYDWKEASGEHLLEPGERVTVHVSYKITQDDIEQGKTDNTVTVTGRTPDGNDTPPAEASVTVPIERKDSVDLEKSADKSLISKAHVGDHVKYTIKVTNSGNTILHEIVLKDELEGLTPLEYDWTGASKGEGTLMPGESMTATASVAVTQTDIDSGRVLNKAVVSAKNGSDEPVGPAEDDAETKLGGKTAFTVNKAVDKTTISNAAAGDLLTYTITGTNTGDVTLTNVTIKDPVKGVTSLTYDWSDASGGEGILLPGESVTATCTYTITQADIVNGRFENTAVMSARNPEGETSEKEAKVTTTLKRQPTPTPTPVKVNGTNGNPSAGNVTTNNRTVTGSSPAQGGGTVTYSKSGDVKTGDESHAELWTAAALIALLAGGVVLIRRKRT